MVSLYSYCLSPFAIFIYIKISHDVFTRLTCMCLDLPQGVTLVAFGNGAPDVFSAFAAIKNAKNGDIGLAIGALLGNAVHILTLLFEL